MRGIPPNSGPTTTEKRPRPAASAPLLLILAAGIAWLLVSYESAINPLHDEASPPNPYAKDNSAVQRRVHNLIFWKQRKTGSSSIRIWLQEIARQANLNIAVNGTALFFPVEDFHSRVGNLNCTVFAGHIVIRDVRLRRHEAEKGALFTTTRDVYNHLVSKYYHNTKRVFMVDLPKLAKNNSQAAAIWYLTWREYDPCEPMRYYDGVPGCSLTDDGLRARAAAVASRIDCVVDMEDSRPDLEAICAAMGLERCPKVPTKKVRPGSDQYHQILRYPHIRDSLNASAHALQILRDAFLKRRCRDMLGGGANSGRERNTGELPPAKWPTPSCKQEYGWQPESLLAAS